MNIRQLFTKKVLFIIVVIIILAVILFVVLIGAKKEEVPPPAANITPAPSAALPLAITAVIPDKTAVLTPGKNQTFTVYFNQPTTAETVTVTLTKQDVTTSQQPQPAKITSTLNNDGKTMEIKTLEDIAPNSIYTLSVAHGNGNTVIISYTTANKSTTPELTNNLTLVPYLPRETLSYKLSYLKERNIYVFNFYYDDASSVDLQTQYERAKADAEEFIRSKGIVLTTIAIEWRHY